MTIDPETSNEWGNLLATLGKASEQKLDEVITPEEDAPEVYTPLTEGKTYGTTRKTYGRRAKVEVLTALEESKALESYIDYTPEKHKSTSRTRKPRASRVRVSDTIDEPRKPVKSQPSNDAAVWFTTAETHLKRGNLDGAEEAFLRGLEIIEVEEMSGSDSVSLQMGKHKYDEAVISLKYATERLPAHSTAWYQLGYCYQKLNKWKESLEPLKRATQLNLKKPDFWMALGLAEFHLGENQAAAKSFLRVVRISPNHKDALFYLAMCMERQGNRKHSLSLYLKLMNLDGLKPKMLERMAGAFERLNRPREAREARRRAAVARRAGIQ